MATPRLCSIPDCGKAVSKRGWCNAHYIRWRRHGDPLVLIRPPNGALERHLHDIVLPYDGDECLVWPFWRNNYGYASMTSGGKTSLVSRVVCEYHHGPPPTPNHDAAHSCGRGHDGCVTKRHLRWATRAENFADMVSHGTRLRGERQNGAKLTKSQVRAIRALGDAMADSVIANRFGVCRGTISRIQRGASWAWLDDAG